MALLLDEKGGGVMDLQNRAQVVQEYLLKTYGIRSEAELLAEFAKLQPLSIEALVSRPNIAAVKSA